MIVQRLLDLVVPPRCLACTAPEHPLCAACRAALPWLRGARCERCGLRPHAACPASGFAFDAAWAPMAHEGVARELVRALKHDARIPVADVMAAQIAATAPREPCAVVVPVPADAARLRARGVDHAGLVARAYARRTKQPLQRALVRRGGGRQVGGGRTARLSARTAYVARDAPRVACVVDDVHTTGATLDACAHALKAAGAERVLALTYTRAL